MPAAVFNPDPTAAAAILDAYIRPDSSLFDLARTHNTTVESLATWLATPDIAERVNLLQSAAIDHARLAATTQLPKVVRVITRTLEAPPRDGSPEQQRRDHQSALRAAALLYRIARLRCPSLREGAGGRERSRSSETRVNAVTVAAAPKRPTIPPLPACAPPRPPAPPGRRGTSRTHRARFDLSARAANVVSEVADRRVAAAAPEPRTPRNVNRAQAPIPARADSSAPRVSTARDPKRQSSPARSTASARPP